MKFNSLFSINKKAILFFLGIIIIIVGIVPLILDLVDFDLKIQAISFLGSFLIITIILITIIDLFYISIMKKNYYFFPFLNMSLSVSLFLLLEYCFLNNYYDFVYVWNYSELTLPIIYKIVAIWAGEAGSIMTWMVFNSIVISFYRIKNQNKDDIVFIRSVIFALIISMVFLLILYSLNPFEVETPFIFPNGRGLNPLLLSPFMIWHPFFIFISYAIFLIPFSITIAEILTPHSNLQNSYQQTYNNFALKFGWLVLTLAIGIGAYWAKITLDWGRYWGWDPVETVSLLPWFFSTAFFHSITFRKKNKKLIEINTILIFLTIIFSTLITRGGGFNSLHAFTGDTDLILWVSIVGVISIVLSIYVIYNVLNSLFEEYKNTKLFFDYLSYLFLYLLSFICIFGLLIPPLTYLFSNFLPINPIYISTDYYSTGNLIPAIGLAISLIFCSLWGSYKVKWIGATIFIGTSILAIFSIAMLFTLEFWINPVIIIFIFALFASLLKFLFNFNVREGFKRFFRINSKTIVHTGISLILTGTLVGMNVFQDILYISGFVFLLVGIIPSILMIFFVKKKGADS